MSSFKMFGRDDDWYPPLGVSYEFDDDADELGFNIPAFGTTYLSRAAVTELRDHLNDVLGDASE